LVWGCREENLAALVGNIGLLDIPVKRGPSQKSAARFNLSRLD
jgi:hypothetical protein